MKECRFNNLCNSALTISVFVAIIYAWSLTNDENYTVETENLLKYERVVMKKRDAIWQQLKDKDSCEVLILGGGINGTGLLRDLAAQGISCVLVDKSDFTTGASSTSSRMIHGGLRYLENAEFKLVSEAVAERNRLLRRANHWLSRQMRFPCSPVIQ